jgi:hypothetical protein
MLLLKTKLNRLFRPITCEEGHRQVPLGIFPFKYAHGYYYFINFFGRMRKNNKLCNRLHSFHNQLTAINCH